MSEQDIIVVQQARPNSAVAPEVAKYLKSHPHENTVQEISEALDVPRSQVIDILNNYSPNEDSTVERMPDGQGGGWLPYLIAEQYRTESQPDTPRGVDLGHRWPDNSLRDVVFDIDDPEHRAEMGIPDPE